MHKTLKEIIDDARWKIEKMLDNGHDEESIFIREQKVIIRFAHDLAFAVDRAL